MTITQSRVTGNGFNAPADRPPDTPVGTPPGPGDLPQAFGISLFGVSDAVVTRNTVYNNGRGGIGVMDTGPFDPGHVVGQGTSPSRAVPVRNVTVSRNSLWANYNGCAIVVSAFNASNTVRDVAVTRNTVRGTGIGAHGADVGGIVAQSNGQSSMVRDISISRNRVTGSVEGGVIVHASAASSHTRNIDVTRNVLKANNQGMGESGATTGIVVSVIGPPAGQTNEHTVVTRNVITDQLYGVWTSGKYPPVLWRNTIRVPSGGERYYAAH